jgi:O-methyltransferase
MNRITARRFAKDLAFRTPLRSHVGARYSYRFTPAQLAFLCDCLVETSGVTGCVVEAGCASGFTTLFLNHHMASAGIEKPYFAIDTFSGFRDEDLDVEVARGKDREYHRGRFAVNDQRWFDLTMRRDPTTRTRVHSIRADVGAFDFGELAPIAFALLDVVFYRPTKLALPRIWDALAPGGLVVVDDCRSYQNADDGAGQAYHEVMADMGRAPRVEVDKCGLLVKER